MPRLTAKADQPVWSGAESPQELRRPPSVTGNVWPVYPATNVPGSGNRARQPAGEHASVADRNLPCIRVLQPQNRFTRHSRDNRAESVQPSLAKKTSPLYEQPLFTLGRRRNKVKSGLTMVEPGGATLISPWFGRFCAAFRPLPLPLCFRSCTN